MSLVFHIKVYRLAFALFSLALVQCAPQSVSAVNNSERVSQQSEASMEELIQQLAVKGGDTAAIALGKLVDMGKTAVPALVLALDSKDEQVRALAAEGLSQIADPSTANRMFLALKDSNQKVRAFAARTLDVIKDPRALDALILTIDDAEDVLHYPYTVSVYALVRKPPAILPKIVPLLKAKGQVTRVRAFLVLKTIVSAWKGQDWNKLWEQLGKYDPAAEETARNTAADRWAVWLGQNLK
jgi:HEAT repeat protein